MSDSNAAAPSTIVLIHGLFVTALSWEHWAERYEARGFEVIARSFPGMEGDIDALRADTSAIDDLGIEEIVEHYAGIVEELPAPPIIMGHSFGGVFTQILLDRGLGAARRRGRPGAGEGPPRRPGNRRQGGVPGAEEPGQPPPRCGPHRRRVPLRSRTRCPKWSPMIYDAGAAGAGPRPVPGRARQPQPHAANAIDFRNDDRAPLLLIAGGGPSAPESQTEAKPSRSTRSEAVTELVLPGALALHAREPGWRRSPTTRLDCRPLRPPQET